MLPSLLALALVDSINPSAIVVPFTCWGASAFRHRSLSTSPRSFVTYLALGAMMMSGIGALLPSVRPLADGRLGFLVQSLVGLAMLVYAVRAPAIATSAPRVEPQAATYAALALLGVTVTASGRPPRRCGNFVGSYRPCDGSSRSRCGVVPDISTGVEIRRHAR